jgi:transmembrane sensor
VKNTLIDRFLKGTITRSELSLLRDEINRNEDGMLNALEEDWNQFDDKLHADWPTDKWEEIEAKISEKDTSAKTLSFYLHKWPMKVAASLLIVASVWFALKMPKHQIAEKNDSPAMITKVNDTNQPVEVMLKDGTKVTLTAHSNISYYENFNSKYRVVHLEGEAFFETDQSNKRPFVVISDNITSICRGEEFSISAYKESDEINVTLASGMIEIAQNDRLNSENNKVSVKSCQRYSFNKSNQQYLIGQISNCEYDEKVRSMKNKDSDRVVML